MYGSTTGWTWDRYQKNEIEKDQCTGRLQLILRNYWQNVISDKLRIMAAFVPEDENRTILYVRIYQKFINIPFISSFNKLHYHEI
jgi:hypothetical protein